MNKVGKNFKAARIGFWDFVIGFLFAIWLSDSFIEPLFADPQASYGIKLWHWLIVTVIFLVMGAVFVTISVYIRGLLMRSKKTKSKNRKR